MKISVYSSCDSVIMELNGKKVGSVILEDSMKYRTNLDIAYEPGELKAIGYLNGIIDEIKYLRTSGTVYGIRMVSDRTVIQADRNDLAFISVETIDKTGLRVPDAEILIDFEILGAGELAGVGNGNPTNIKSFQQPQCETFKGRCLIIVRPLEGETGKILVKAKTTSFPESELTIDIIN